MYIYICRCNIPSHNSTVYHTIRHVTNGEGRHGDERQAEEGRSSRHSRVHAAAAGSAGDALGSGADESIAITDIHFSSMDLFVCYRL